MTIGGISSNFPALKASLFLSSTVALTGIAAPIGLSFFLLGLLPLSPVQAFVAGAALCSTSLGTTFTVLATSGLTGSRLGVVLSSAALLDDIVGLVMVQIISSLGAGSTFSAITVVRPVFVSIAFAVLIPLVCLFVAKPVIQGASAYFDRSQDSKYRCIFHSSKAAFIYQTGVLLAMITGATYAGTSNLLAAYLAGASVTWLGDCAASDQCEQPSGPDPTISPASRQASRRSPSNETRPSGPEVAMESRDTNASPHTHEPADDCSGKKVYETYYSPVVDSILRPFFFASIGFSIPITRMFSGRVIWRGLVYTILMTFGKMICGLWLMRFTPMPRAKGISKTVASVKFPAFGFARSDARNLGPTDENSAPADPSVDPNQRPLPAVMRQSSSSRHRSPAIVGPGQSEPADDASAPDTRPAANTARKGATLPRPKSLYPAAILGSAMVARGEIGFLISSVAESSGVFGQGGNTEEFLVVTWAILLCTLIGPITVGLLVKRVRRLQQIERMKADGQEDPLGIWGVLLSSATS